jgi:hypothetical protein
VVFVFGARNFPSGSSRGEVEATERRAKANNWTDAERSELDSGVMAFFSPFHWRR